MPCSRRIKIGLLPLLLSLILWSSLGWTHTTAPLLLEEASVRGQGHSFESEHRPRPMRKYLVKTKLDLKQTEAFVRRPEGEITPARFSQKEGKVQVSFPTPMGDGPMHGIHTLYLVERKVIRRTLWVRIAKWHTIHHSCGWGHGYKYDSERLNPAPVDAIPLEICCPKLWDANFHSKIQSGDKLHFTVLSKGEPAAKTDVSLTSGKGWSKSGLTGKDGSIFFTLIRDYYPPLRNAFDRSHKERFCVVARKKNKAMGTYAGVRYERIEYVSSLVWTYLPARREYTFQTVGLLIAFVSFSFVAGTVYLHRQRRTRPYQEICFDEKD